MSCVLNTLSGVPLATCLVSYGLGGGGGVLCLSSLGDVSFGGD